MEERRYFRLVIFVKAKDVHNLVFKSFCLIDKFTQATFADVAVSDNANNKDVKAFILYCTHVLMPCVRTYIYVCKKTVDLYD